MLFLQNKLHPIIHYIVYGLTKQLLPDVKLY